MSDNKDKMNDLFQIRELIFGENIKEYEKRFSTIDANLQNITGTLKEQEKQLLELKAMLTDIEKKLVSKMSAQNTEVETQLERLRQDFEMKFQELAADKTDRLQIGNYLIEMGLRLKGENVIDNLVKQNDSDKNE